MKIINGDSLEVLKRLTANSIDAVVTDPPYGLSFMGKKWDYDVPSSELWVEVLRILKPGGHLLSFAGSRTYHRMAVNIEDAGFEIRDQIMWVYGSGFPKSHNIGKSVDKLQGNEREIVGIQKLGGNAAQSTKEKGGTYASNTNAIGVEPIDITLTKGSSPYEGWGTALKPAHEPIVVARKPLSEKTIAKNVLEWGTGGINIDGCRVGTDLMIGGSAKSAENIMKTGLKSDYKSPDQIGRFPANFIHDGSDEVVGLFPNSTKGGKPKTGAQGFNNKYVGGENINKGVNSTFYDNGGGSASRFFYCAKASKKDRNEGLPEDKPSTHPTVKPTALMQYLVRLVTPVGGTVLDPFMGSGSTGKACVLEGFDFIGIELDPEYCKIAQARIRNNN